MYYYLLIIVLFSIGTVNLLPHSIMINNLYFSVNTLAYADSKAQFSLMFYEAKELDQYPAHTKKIKRKTSSVL